MSAIQLLIAKLDKRYQEKAHQLCSGAVPDDRYRAQVEYMKALRDVLKEVDEAVKEAKEGR